MQLEKGNSSDKFYIVLTTLMAGILMVVYAAQLTVPINGDESITMANAAYATGRDWSLMVADIGGRYYRYLQPLLTVPFFAWLNDPANIYRFTMILQALIQVSTIPIVYLICRRHLKMKSAAMASLIAAVVCFVPSIALYVFYFRGDFLLPVLPWYALLFFLETIRAVKEQKRARRIVFTVLVMLCCIFDYMAHTRGIILMIALVITALAVRILMKQRSIHWPVFLVTIIPLAILDLWVSGKFENAVYALSGVTGNSFDSANVGHYFNLFSYSSLKSFFMLCVGWLNTLITTTEGLVLIGGIAVIVIAVRLLRKSLPDISDEEKITVLFSFLVFAGYFAIGALFFRNVYINLATGEVTRRVDRLMYDRYSICGAGMLVFVALYVICCHRDWIGRKLKICMMAIAVLIFGIFMWKGMPLIVKYKGRGFVNNTITLNTFETAKEGASVISRYSREALLAAFILGLMMLAGVLILSCVKKNRMSYILLVFVLVCDLALVQVNYVKCRKASNDRVKAETEKVVGLLQEMEGEITETYPYVLSSSTSGNGVAYYQPQLLDYKLLGEEQAKDIGQENYFIISSQEDTDFPWDDEDYYLFEDFDYDEPDQDIVYVKGEDLAAELEELGYPMVPLTFYAEAAG